MMEAEGRSQAVTWLTLGVGICMGLLLSRSRIIRKLLPAPAKIENGAPASRSSSVEQFAESKERFKVVFAARQDLKMTSGKIAAQCGHAAIGIYKAASKYCPDALRNWERYGQPKVVLKVPTEDEMTQLERVAREKGLLTKIICDAGHTQVAPGSATVLGIGPGPSSVVDSVTGHLKLY